MTLINLTPQNFTFTVNGFDYTPQLLEGTGNWSSFDDSGLFIITGRFILSDIPDAPKTIDDRYNDDFCRGNEIKFLLNGTEAPVIGTTRVESARYDEGEARLDLSFTCWLGILNALEAKTLGACVALGSSVQASDGIIAFLENSGLDPGFIDISSFGNNLSRSVFSQSQGSFIATAGQIAFANGHALYQDHLGIIKDLTFTPAYSGNVLSIGIEDTVLWERIQDSTVPPDQVVVNYATEKVNERDDSGVKKNFNQEDDTYTRAIEPFSAGQARLQTVNAKKFVTTVTSILGRTITTSTSEIRSAEAVANSVLASIPEDVRPNFIGDVISERRITVETFEPPGQSPSTGSSSISDCYPPDEGRMISRGYSVFQPAFIAFAAAAAQALSDFGGTPEELRAKGKNAAARDLESRLNTYLAASLVRTETNLETWNYNIPVTTAGLTEINTTIQELLEEGGGSPVTGNIGVAGGSGAGGANSQVSYNSITTGIIGNAIPLVGSPTLGTASADGVQGSLTKPHISVNPSSSIIKAKNQQVWKLDGGDQSTWRTEFSNNLLTFDAKPELVQAAQQNAADDTTTVTNVNLLNILTTATGLTNIGAGAQEDSPPPDPGRFPAPAAIETTPRKLAINIDSGLACQISRKREINLGEFANAETSALVGKSVGLIEWGRSKSQLIGVDLATVPNDIIPLNTISVQKQSEAVEIYGFDSPTVVFKFDQAIFSTIGLFVGLVPGSNEGFGDPAGGSGGTPGYGGSPPQQPDGSNPTDTVIFPPSPTPDPLNPVILPPVTGPAGPSPFFPLSDGTPPVYEVDVPVALAASTQVCFELTVCGAQIARQGDLDVFIDAYDGCFSPNNVTMGESDSFYDAHPVIIDRFILSSGDGIILQSTTPTADSFRGNASQIVAACLFPVCKDIFSDPPEEEP